MLYGKSGVGKSAFAQSLHERTYCVNRLDQLKDMQPDVKVIVFNDADLSGLTLAEHFINLLDTESDVAIKCRFKDAIIPAGVARVFAKKRVRFGFKSEDS